MKIDLLGIILIIGAFQGFFLSFLILHKGRKLFANRFLFILMMTYGLVLLSLWMFDQGLIYVFPKTLLTLEGIQFLIFPAYFLYAKYLEDFSNKFLWKDLFHFTPFILYKIYQIPFYFMNQEDVFAAQSSIMVENYPLQYVIFNWLIIIKGFIYLPLVLKTTNKYEKHIKEVYSSISKIKLDWLKNATYLALVITIGFLIENILLLSGLYISESFGFSSLLAAVYIYLIGYIGISRSGIFTELIEAKLSQSENIDRASTQERYEKSGLSEEKANLYHDHLIKLMLDKFPYRNSKLTLGELADQLLISSHNLSEVINTKENKNFFDFVNTYRINEVKQELINPENENLTILAIAMESGFNSKTSFNTLFKKYVGMTPTEYRSKKRIR